MMSIIALVCALLALAGCGICSLLIWRLRRAALYTATALAELDGKLTEHKQELNRLTQRTTDQARRTAWADSRARTNSFDMEATAAGSSAVAPSKLSITERRHRVLSLARRGLDVQSIASTVGVAQGEVELIIGLNEVT